MKKDNQGKKSRKMEEKLTNALVELLKTKNLLDITVTQLLETADVPKSSFYRRYDGIDDLVESIEDEILDDIRDIAKYMIGSIPCMSKEDKTNDYVLRLFAYLYDHRDIYLALTSANGDMGFEYKHDRLIREFYGGKIAFEGWHTDYPEFYMRFALAGHDAILKYWLQERDDISPEEMSMIAQNLMYGPYFEKVREP